MLTKADQFPETLAKLAERAKALSHPARLSILQILAARDTCICGDLVDELPLAQASVSRHLKTLKDAGLIQGEVDGPRSCYCVNGQELKALQQEMNAFFEELRLEASETDCC